MKSQLKSIHLTNYYHKNSGGISTSYNSLLAAAERHKRYVRLIVPGEIEEIEDVNEYGRIYYIPAAKSPVFDRRYRLIMPWQYFPHGTLIRKIMVAEKPDIVEICDRFFLSTLGAMIRTHNFAKLGRPMLVNFSCERLDDNMASYVSKGVTGKWITRRGIANYSFPMFDYHLANSHYTASEFHEAIEAENLPGHSNRVLNFCWRYFKAAKVKPVERIFVCPCGIDPAFFHPRRKSAENRRKMHEDTDTPESAALLMYAGRISPEKNIGLLTDVMDSLQNDEREYRLLIAGAGPQKEALEKEAARRFPGKIIMLGHLDKETLADYYANADVFVHPNPREPFGIGPLEAMASGVPVVAPNAGGVLSYATQENAWLCETSGESFAAAIREVISDENLREQKTSVARKTAEENTRERSTDYIFETYDRMYADFKSREELFTYRKRTNFNFADLLK